MRLALGLVGVTVAIAACLGGAHAVLARTNATAPECTAVKLVGVRGSGDTSSTLGVIATALSGGLAKRAQAVGLSYHGYGLPYAAVGITWYAIAHGLQLPEYRLSVRDGRNKLYGFIHEQARDCPSEKLAVVGYSQGAQVVGDVFSKGLDRLTASERARVKAVVLVADPRFNSREPYDRGSFREGRNGLLGARSLGDLTSVSNRLHAWCRKDDLICQGPGSTGNHAQAKYVQDYKDAMVKFLANKLGLPKRGTPRITTTSLPAATLGIAYSQTLQAAGGSQPYSWSVSKGSLPAGITLNSSTGVVSGTPTATGTSNFSVTVRDSRGSSSVASLSIAVTAEPPIQLVSWSVTVQPDRTATFTFVVNGGDGLGFYEQFSPAWGSFGYLCLDPSNPTVVTGSGGFVYDATNLVSPSGVERTYKFVMTPDKWPGLYGDCHSDGSYLTGLDSSTQDFPDEAALEAAGLYGTWVVPQG